MRPAVFACALLGSSVLFFHAQEARAALEVHLPPWYDSDGPKARVGPYSEGLVSGDKRRVLATVMKMKGAMRRLSVESMYVAAIRLYDLGLRDAALYWFYSAQYRTRLAQAVLLPIQKDHKELAAAQ